MRLIDDLRNKHKDEEIWILGCGPSLDDFPDDFFDRTKNRTSIALNWSIIGFPQCTYWHAGHPNAVIWMMKHKPEILKKSILALPFAPLPGQDYFTEEQSLTLLGPYKNDPIYLRWHWIMGNYKRFRALLEPTIRCIMNQQTCHYISLSTSLHYAIQIAAVLGGKKITLIGSEKTIQEGERHAVKRGMSQFYTGNAGVQKLRSKRWRLGIKSLAEAFKSHGIEIQRYYYGKGYENIV